MFYDREGDLYTTMEKILTKGNLVSKGNIFYFGVGCAFTACAVSVIIDETTARPNIFKTAYTWIYFDLEKNTYSRIKVNNRL